MNLEINIKVPVGEGVSVSQQTQRETTAAAGPPAITEITQPEAGVSGGEVLPPSLSELGLVPERREPAPAPAVPPPSLSELGLTEAVPVAEVEHEPPSLAMLEPIGGAAATAEAAAAPPSLEELGVAGESVTDEMAPPSVEELEAIAGQSPPESEELPTKPETMQPKARGRAQKRSPG